MSRALTFTLAVAAAVALGDPPTRAHPVGLMGRAARTPRRRAPSDADQRGSFGVALEKHGAYTLGVGLPVPAAGDVRRAVRLASAAAVIAGASMLGALVARELAR